MGYEKEILIDGERRESLPSPNSTNESSCDGLSSNYQNSQNQPENIRQINGGGVVYICFVFVGLGTLLPWNFFINADSYWQYKFRNTSEPMDDWERRETSLQKLFNPFLVSLSQTTNFSFLLVNTFFGHMFPKQLTLVGSLLVMVLFFTITTILSEVDTDHWQLGLFILTMIVLVIINGAGALFLGGFYGITAKFPHRFINALGVGQALGGVFAAISRIVSIYFGINEVTSAFIYFFIAVAVMILILIAYLLVSRSTFFKFYADHLPEPVNHDDSKEHLTPSRTLSTFVRDHLRIFKKIWLLAFSVAFVFFVSLSVFPSVCVKILSSSKDKIWADKYFHPVMTFLLFNSGDYLGRVVSEFLLWPMSWCNSLCYLSFLRVIFIPLFLLCSHSPTSVIPSIFTNDFYYVAFMVIFSLSNGYCLSVFMMHAPKMVPATESEKVGSMMATMIGLGLLLGSFLSFVLALLC